MRRGQRRLRDDEWLVAVTAGNALDQAEILYRAALDLLEGRGRPSVDLPAVTVTPRVAAARRSVSDDLRQRLDRALELRDEARRHYERCWHHIVGRQAVPDVAAAPAAPAAPAGGRRSIVRQTGAAGIAAAVAVGSGLILDVALAARLGAGTASDGFFAGVRIPLGAVAVVMVGANQALVPLFSTWRVRVGDRGMADGVAKVLNATVLASTVMAVLVAVAARPLVALTVPGFGDAEVDAAASVARITAFVLPLVCGAEVLRAYLNARFAYVVAAAMNVALNVTAAGLVVVGGAGKVRWAAWAYLAGAVAQLLFMLVAALGRGWRPRLGVRAPEVGEAGRLTTRPLVAAGLNPAARLVEQAVVSFLPAGTLTVVNYGYRLISAVGGAVFFRSVVVAIVPRLTEATARGDEDQVRRTTALGLRVMLAIALPLTAFMAVLARPAVQVLFRRGSFDRSDAALLGLVLAVYAASLAGSGVQRALLAPFFARLDTRTPLRNTVYGVVANVVLLVALIQVDRDSERWAVAAIALSYSAAQYVHVAHAARRLRAVVGPPFAGTWQWTAKVAAASAASAGAQWAVVASTGLLDERDRVRVAALTLAAALAGVVVLALALRVLLGDDLRDALKSLRRGRSKSRQ